MTTSLGHADEFGLMNDDQLDLGHALVQSLQNSHAPVSTELALIETHISWVILTSNDAWKIKKPVKFRYMDFSTLERREQVCRRELEINRTNAPPRPKRWTCFRSRPFSAVRRIC